MFHRPIRVGEWRLDDLEPGIGLSIPNDGINLVHVAECLGLMCSTQGTIFDNELWLSDLRPPHRKIAESVGNRLHMTFWEKSGVAGWIRGTWLTYVNKLPLDPDGWAYQLKADVTWLPGVVNPRSEKSDTRVALTPNMSVVIHPAFQWFVDIKQMEPGEAPRIARLRGWEIVGPLSESRPKV